MALNKLGTIVSLARKPVMNIIDNADLEQAAQTARQLKRWELMPTVLPVAIPGGTGFPVNPIAIVF